MEVCGIHTRVPQMQRVLEKIRVYGPLDTAVLIQGETGTGKELVARALHALSRRAHKPIVTADCAALPETLAESELFGYERGAFTGADRPYPGRLEAAAGGTLFLDEVNSLSPGVQAKLLRFLESGEVTRLGQQRPLFVNVRIISATNAPLEELVASGRMRADFFYRLNVLKIDVPPLRERLADVPLLVEQFLSQDPLARQLGVRGVREEVIEKLRSHSWPGNVRELLNALRRSVALGAEGGVLERCYNEVRESPRSQPAGHKGLTRPPTRFREWMREQERRYLAELVERHARVSEQVEASGLPQRTLYRKLAALGFRGRGAASFLVRLGLLAVFGGL